jgi:hypothetical protein
MRKIFRSSMSWPLKRKLFIASVKSILPYGAESWTMTKAQEDSINERYSRMLRVALNVSWSAHISNTDLYAGLHRDLYAGLHRVTDKIRERILKLAGHCVRHSELAASPFILWEPTQGKATRGRRRHTYVDLLMTLATQQLRSWGRVCWTGRSGVRLSIWPKMLLLIQPRPDDDDDDWCEKAVCLRTVKQYSDSQYRN